MNILNQVSRIYEDDDLLVINKPAGLPVHSDGRTDEVTLVDWVLDTHPIMKDVGEPLRLRTSTELSRTSSGQTEGVITRPGIVHRIDRETSGVLVLAKNAKSFEYLKSQFKNRLVRKEYSAFVYGKVEKDFGTVDLPIGRSTRDFRQRSTQKSARGVMREAQTYYEVIKRGGEATFVKALPKTGRTHQIRVHLKSIGHPVVADPLYAPGRPKILGFERLALHARSLELTGQDGQKHIFEAPYPEDFERAIENF